jgi:hypothetical protein
MPISASQVTRMSLNGGMWVPLHTTFPAKSTQVVLGLFNAFAYFATGSTVSIVIYDPDNDGAVVATDDATCVEIAGTGVFTWSLDNLTNYPRLYKQYAWRMTDGSEFESGDVVSDPFTTSRLNPILHR